MAPAMYITAAALIWLLALPFLSAKKEKVFST